MAVEKFCSLKIELDFETRIIVTFEILNLIWSLDHVKLEFEGMFGILNLIRNSWSREKLERVKNSNSRPVTDGFVEAYGILNLIWMMGRVKKKKKLN